MLDQVVGAKIFSKLDLRSSYHQIRIKEEYVNQTSFWTRYGHHEFVVIPFVLSNSPSTFMCLMNSVLNKNLDKFLLIFIDDILIKSNKEEGHQQQLNVVL